MDVQFKCPCGATLTAHEKDVHRTIACQHCGRVLVVPAVPVAAGIGAREDEDFAAAEVAPRQTGSPGAAAAAGEKAGVSGLAVASLVLGVVGPFLGVLSIVAGVLAIVFGGAAIRAIAASVGMQGRGMAIAGIVLGAINVALSLTLIFLAQAGRPPEDSLDVVCFVLRCVS